MNQLRYTVVIITWQYFPSCNVSCQRNCGKFRIDQESAADLCQHIFIRVQVLTALVMNKYCPLGYNAMLSVKSQLTFRRNIYQRQLT
jgi:hypothetical protein